uniref:pentatricopeptide repeat-containing protein At1g06270 n=1 Tax=Erigeron canadensis TaxID=72917 RepID=UPI001CB90CCF|nr:pentatricopeptide repeat-containing protein At1g06270 [Erigeron canadensis]XP_043626351.1 pentatricopeptide repeat-containing protein At1g06270 [Erigeron canadensis]
MALSVPRLRKPLISFSFQSMYFSSVINSVSSQRLVENSIQDAVTAKSYQQIADILGVSKETCQTSNPFSFLINFHQDQRTKIIDEILQSFVSLRPRDRPRVAYAYLLSFTLQSSNPLPLSLAVLQRTLRSGCSPVPQTHLLLSTVWLHERKQTDESVASMLLQMKSIGYRPDGGVCNYLISSLCKVDQYEEAVHVLRCMAGAGCVPDLESFGSVIGLLCDLRKTKYIEELMKELVVKFRLSPRKEMVVKVLKAMRANKDVHKAVEMINFLEEMNIQIGFESYELAVEMCLESGLFVLGGKVALRMTDRGFIPYIKVRQKVFEGLTAIGELDFAYILKKRFTELNS